MTSIQSCWRPHAGEGKKLYQENDMVDIGKEFPEIDQEKEYQENDMVDIGKEFPGLDQEKELCQEVEMCQEI